MDYLVTMTTHVPDGTPDHAVADVRAREASPAYEAARSREADRSREAARPRELAAQGHLRRLWRPPPHLGDPVARP